MENESRRDSHVVRLLRLVLELQGGRVPGVSQLSQICGVSRRTVFRDLEAIELAGLTVVYDAQRRGYRLSGGTPFPPPPIDPKEVVALYLMHQQLIDDDELGLGRWSLSGSRKLLYALSREQRLRVESAAPGSFNEQKDHPLSSSFLSMLIDGGGVRLHFNGSPLPSTTRSAAKIALPAIDLVVPRVLYDNGWKIIGHSPEDTRPWTVDLADVGRIEKIGVETAAKPPPSLPDYLASSKAFSPIASEPFETIIRIDPNRLAELNELGWSPNQRSDLLLDGKVDVKFTANDAKSLIDWVVLHRDSVELRWPPQIRRRIREAAQRLVSRYHTDEPLMATGVFDEVKNERLRQVSDRL